MKSAFGVEHISKSDDNKRKAIIAGGSVAGAGAGGAIGYKVGTTNGAQQWYARTKSRMSSAGKPLSDADMSNMPSKVSPEARKKMLAAGVKAKQAGGRAGLITGATLGGALGLETARHFTKKKTTE